MRKIVIILIAALFSCSSEKKPDWIPLFNGKDLKDWTAKFSGYQPGINYKNTFRVENGILKVSYDDYNVFNGEFGHLFYKNSFSHYKIRAEYRFVEKQIPGAPQWAFRNNGLMLHCQSPGSMALNQNFPVCIEVQLLGDDGTGDRPCGNPCTPGTNFVKDDSLITEHCPPLSRKTVSADSWHTMEVIVNGSTFFTHILDGDTVAFYEYPQLDKTDPDAQQLLKTGDIMLGEGYIAIQAETHPAEFRKIELLVLEK